MRVPSHNGLRSRLGVVAADGGQIRLAGPAEGQVGVWSWSPSGDRIFFAGDDHQSWQPDLFVLDLADGSVRRLTDDLQVLPDAGFPTVLPPAQPVWLDERRVLMHALRGGASGLYVVDTETGSVERTLAWQAQLQGLSVDAGRRQVAQSYLGYDSPGDILLTDLQTGASRLMLRPNAELLEESPPAQWERLDVSRGDLTIEAWLLKPADFDPNRRYPVVLDVHGGPQGYYGYAFNNIQQCLAGSGFLVVYSNPRGSGSYGRTFAQQVIEDWGGEDFKDLMAVLDSVLERPYADPERTGIYGYSYGGYMTSWTIGQTGRFQAAVCGAPVFDLESFYGTSDIGHIFGERQFGGPPHERRQWYAAHSPSEFAQRVTTPTLILHGEADDRCPIGQGEQMYIALLKAGVEVEFARYPGGSHLLMRSGPPDHKVDFLTRVLGWFQGHLREPAPEAVGRAATIS
jgi:dipeptidyl aminopeptidase/acylaminoacyl peptidase